jgi:2-dehydropantoate 2-reductase
MTGRRFVVFGAGAIGGVIGARLFQHGHSVELVARGSHFDAIRRSGLRIDDPDGHAVLDLPVQRRPGDIQWRPDDIVVLAVKSQDSLPALRELAEVAPGDVPVVCAQNGVDNERQAARFFGAVYGVCVMLPATHLRPGVVQASSLPTTGILDTGRYPRGEDDVAQTVAAAFRSSTFDADAVADIMRWKYTKLLMNLANAVEAASGHDEQAAELIRLARREGVAALRAAGIEFASREEDQARRGDLLQLRPVGDVPRSGGSSWQSLARGTGSIETDYLNGEIVLLGRKHGVPTPVNATLQVVARQMARRRLPPGSMPAKELLERVAR